MSLNTHLRRQVTSVHVPPARSSDPCAQVRQRERERPARHNRALCIVFAVRESFTHTIAVGRGPARLASQLHALRSLPGQEGGFTINLVWFGYRRRGDSAEATSALNMFGSAYCWTGHASEV